MRRLGHQTVDLLVGMLQDPTPGGEPWRRLGHQPAALLVGFPQAPPPPARRGASPAEMADRTPPQASDVPQHFDALLTQLRDDVFAHMSRLDHPRYFAFIP